MNFPKKGIGFWFEELKGQQIHFLACPEGLCTSQMSCSFLKFVQDQLLAFTLLPSSSVPFYSWHVLPRKTDFNQTTSQPLVYPPAGCILQPSNHLHASILLSSVFILLFPKEPLCWLPKLSSTVTEGEAVSLVLLFWAAQHSLSCHSLQRAVAEISAQAPLQVQSPCSSVVSSFFWSWIIGKWLNSLAYHIVAIPQFKILLIPVLCPHFLSNELRLLPKNPTSFSLVTVLTIPCLMYEGSSFANSCRIFHLLWFWPMTLLWYKVVLIHKSEYSSAD